jgi:hypothetical protein
MIVMRMCAEDSQDTQLLLLYVPRYVVAIIARIDDDSVSIRVQGDPTVRRPFTGHDLMSLDG